MPRHVPRHGRLKDVGIADFANAAKHPLPFQPVDSRLNGGVSGTRFGKRLLNLPNGGFSMGPESLEDLKLELTEFWLGLLYYHLFDTTTM